MILYHATFRDILPFIRKDGLDGTVDPIHLAEIPGFYDEGDHLREFIASVHQASLDEVVLLRVNLDLSRCRPHYRNGVGVLALQAGWDGEGTWALTGVIPPEDITLVDTDGKQL